MKPAKQASDDAEGGEETAAAAPTRPAGRRRLALIVGAGLLLAIGALAASAYAFGLIDMLLGQGHAAEERDSDKTTAAPVFYALPDLLVSLNTGERRSTFLKVKINLQLAAAGDQPHIQQLLPRIIDYCQVYLRELRLDELRGSAGTARLREELLRRISAAVAPVQVTDVLFGEIFVQ